MTAPLSCRLWTSYKWYISGIAFPVPFGHKLSSKFMRTWNFIGNDGWNWVVDNSVIQDIIEGLGVSDCSDFRFVSPSLLELGLVIGYQRWYIINRYF